MIFLTSIDYSNPAKPLPTEQLQASQGDHLGIHHQNFFIIMTNYTPKRS